MWCFSSHSCFQNAPEASPCIIKPELCEAHLGKGRDIEWEEKHHNQPHFVYLAVSSDIKVGITRDTQIPTRWIDQGASKAVIIAKTPYRQMAGEIEVALKDFFVDKTNWRKMLKNELTENSLEEARTKAIEALSDKHKEFVVADEDIQAIKFPVLSYPEKLTSLKLEKEEVIEGVLMGIKGQYLLLDNNRVINIRKHSGYHVIIEEL